ncbi:MAG: hypothetical protein Tp138OMZ00d2C19078261_57 [Prokaryotic dsDNA virus sp.]|jgi:hypothetical protein|nr:MAG: hypothetical protein Tp138OMZ00d2C19078261_57 [Prokaryotic dsDNA virus sp.]|tara:strand:- start:3951 stop:4145 length:195 start_codon:yes stop_codon:yes gene_type:complete
MTPLSGYKTYIIVAIYLLCIGAEKLLGFDIPGFEPTDDWLVYVLNALGLGTLRAGITKAAKGIF